MTVVASLDVAAVLHTRQSTATAVEELADIPQQRAPDAVPTVQTGVEENTPELIVIAHCPVPELVAFPLIQSDPPDSVTAQAPPEGAANDAASTLIAPVLPFVTLPTSTGAGMFALIGYTTHSTAEVAENALIVTDPDEDFPRIETVGVNVVAFKIPQRATFVWLPATSKASANPFVPS